METLDQKSNLQAPQRTDRDHVKVHTAIAEQGKVHQLKGEYKLAQQYYRHAMQMAMQSEESHVYLNHYLECLLECLEMDGQYQAIIDYCEKMIGRGKLIASKDFEMESLAKLYLRKGIIQLKMGSMQAGIEALNDALTLIAETKKPLELAQTLIFLHDSGLKLNVKRILAEQKRTNYFVVTEEKTRKEIAMELPKGSLA